MDDGGPGCIHKRTAAHVSAWAEAMNQQYEFKLVEEDAEPLRPEAKFAFRRRGNMPAIIDIEAESDRSATPGKRIRPSKAQPAFLPKGCVAEDAFRLTLLQCKWHISANVPAVVEARDVEGMHQLRVGFRRLRVAFSSFGTEFRTPTFEALKRRAKAIANRLAPARDLDVFLDELFEPAATANGALEAFGVLRSRAHGARRRAWDESVAQITSPSFANFMSDLGEALDRRSWYEATPGGSHATSMIVAFATPATTLADRMLTARLRQSRKGARHLETLSDSARHRLRIKLKKLRYTAEFFAPLYPKKDVEPFLERLSRMQDILGGLNDVAVARTTLESLVERNYTEQDVSPAEVSFAAGIVYGWHLDRAARSWGKGVKRWKRFAKAEPFWHTEA
jgi:CHAD domain-containing protein